MNAEDAALEAWETTLGWDPVPTNVQQSAVRSAARAAFRAGWRSATGAPMPTGDPLRAGWRSAGAAQPCRCGDPELEARLHQGELRLATLNDNQGAFETRLRELEELCGRLNSQVRI